MNHFDRFATLVVFSAVAASFSSATVFAAQQSRSFYQNSSGNCHGATQTDEAKLQRTEQRLKNISTEDADVVCSFSTDAFAVSGPEYVAIWAKTSSAPAKPAERGIGAPAGGNSLTCTLVTSYADDPFSQSITQTVNNLPVAAPGGGQAYIEWFPAGLLSPVNLRCTVQPNVELNDWLIVYQVNVGS